MKLISSTERLREIRSSSEYKNWRTKILGRDGFKCVICHNKNNLEVDHIKPLALYPRLAFKESNGRVLCRNCHKKTNTFGAYSKYKDSSKIHPVLAGDLLFKIQSLPQSVEIWGKNVGFSLCYDVINKKWRAGYKFAKVNFTITENTVERAIDGLFDKLKESTFYKYDIDLIKSNKAK